MTDHMPPLAALRALDAAARHGSFTRAAEELNVTQSAVSHQIRHLEALWGFELFARGTRPLALTRNGKALAPVARDFFERMSTTLESLRVEDTKGALKISTLESFATTWLVPRLSDFNKHCPDISVWISTSEHIVDFTVDDVDLAVRIGLGDYPDLHSTLLLREYVFPVCSTQLIERLGRPKNPADLVHYPLLLRPDETLKVDWEDWFSVAGVKNVNIKQGPRFQNSHMALQAAIAGQGVALLRSAHVDGGLKAAGLTRLFDIRLPADFAYYLVCQKGAEERPRIAAFRQWIEAEAAVSQARYDKEAMSVEAQDSSN